jgi:TIR domain
LILLDLYFPEKNEGLDLLYLLREKRFGVPVIIVTKETYLPQDIVGFTHRGIDSFLAKSDYSISGWRKCFKEVVEASKRHLLLVFAEMDTPFAGWIETALNAPNWRIKYQCGDYQLAELANSINHAHQILPILTPEFVKSPWFKQLSDTLIATNSIHKVIPILYRPCNTKLIQHDPVKLVNFSGDYNAFFTGRKLLIERIVE